jgi:hypothetical protein
MCLDLCRGHLDLSPGPSGILQLRQIVESFLDRELLSPFPAGCLQSVSKRSRDAGH